MKNIRFFLYALLAITSLLLFDAWQKEHPKTIVKENAIAEQQIDYGQLKHNRKKLQEVSSQKIVRSKEENLINVKTDVLNVYIDKKGGKIVRVELLKYPLKMHGKEPFVLLNDDPDTFYIAGSGFIKAEDLNQEHYMQNYRAERRSYVLSEGQNELEVFLKATSKDGLLFTKKFIFKRDSYDIKVDESITNQSSKNWLGHYYMQLSRHDAVHAKRGFLGVSSFHGAAISSPNKPYHKLSFDHLRKESLNENIQGGWLAMLEHYFLSAFIPNANEPYHYYSQITADGVYTVGMIGERVEILPNKSLDFDSKFYVGPKITDILKQVAPHLSMTVDYSSITFFSLLSAFIFNVMKYIHKVVGNWGWSIVIITILIRLLFYKLSVASYKSMAGMKKIQPKIKQLKERFGDNKQAMSKAMMELYKKEKINPLGGCLPILIQIPVFLALYWMLVESVELRQAPFILWIHDLSAKDPYYVLPILMGISMYVQQKLSPAPTDPNQAKVMMFLPIFLTVLFLNFPSGLVLYWVVNNGLSILQQWYITKKVNSNEYNVIKKSDRKDNKNKWI